MISISQFSFNHVSGREQNVPDQHFRELMERFNVMRVNMFGSASNAFKYAYHDYKTLFMNNINQHARGNLKKFLWCYLKKNHPSYNRHERKNFIKNCIGFFFDNKTAVNIPRDSLIDFYHHIFYPSIQFLGPDDDIIAHMQGKLKGAENNATFYQFVPHMLRMQHYIETVNFENMENENASELQKQQMRSFVVVPQYNWQKKHIRIDNECLLKIVNALIPTGEQKWQRGEYDELWNQIFDFKRSIKFQKGMLFNQFIVTDSVSVSIHFIKDRNAPIVLTQTKQRYIHQEKEVVQTTITDEIRNKYTNDEYDKIIGLDPGYKEMVAGCSLNLHDSTEQNIKMSSKHVRASTNWWQRKQKQRKITGNVII